MEEKLPGSSVLKGGNGHLQDAYLALRRPLLEKPPGWQLLFIVKLVTHSLLENWSGKRVGWVLEPKKNMRIIYIGRLSL